MSSVKGGSGGDGGGWKKIEAPRKETHELWNYTRTFTTKAQRDWNNDPANAGKTRARSTSVGVFNATTGVSSKRVHTHHDSLPGDHQPHSLDNVVQDPRDRGGAVAWSNQRFVTRTVKK